MKGARVEHGEDQQAIVSQQPAQGEPQTTLQIGAMVHGSSIYGPGLRTVVWVQGCTLGCPGCWNQQFWPAEGGSHLTIPEVVDAVQQSGDTGLTLLGGEPLEQSEAVLALIHALRQSGVSTMVYTGFELEELDPVQLACIVEADFAIVGPYVARLRSEELRWRGSTNQKLYAHGVEVPVPGPEVRQFEIHEYEGSYLVLGYPPKSVLRAIGSGFVRG
jgi:anaerobic ribonucleoside-triphosphate reductase activating protein